MLTETSCHFGHLLQVSKKSLWSLILYIFFHDFIHVYSPGPGADNLWGFWCQQEHLVTLVICGKFQKNLLEVWFYTNFFMILYMNIAPGRGQSAPKWQILISTERPYHFTHLLQVSKKSLWSLILYNFFHDLIHVYNPGAGADSPQGTKFWCQQKCLVISFICCKFQNNVSEVWFYTFFFHDLIHVYSPRAGSIQPRRDKVLMSTETSCHFSHLLLVSNHRRQQFLKNPLFYLFPIQMHKGPNLTLL